MPDTPLVIGVDVGGTNIESAAVRGREVLASKKKKTRAERGPEAVIDRIATTVTKVLDKLGDEADDVEAVCVGAPGAIDASAGVVRHAPNLDWHDVPLAEALRERVGLPVMLANDVGVGVLGEHVHGAGRGALHMVGIWVGTGIGGAIVVNGALHRGFRGAAGEIGHTVVRPYGRTCGCAREGCVEAYASKTAMMAMIRERMAQGHRSVVPEVMEAKGKQRLTSSVVEAALDADDELMREAVRTAQYHLGLLVAGLVNALDPEVIVFGGGLVERLGEPFLEPVVRTARQHYLQREGAERIRIVPAALGDDAGPVGAGVVARRRLQGIAE